jgi:hypothetical protein
MKYESPITYHSKDMTNVKVFADRQAYKQTDRQTGQKLYAPIFQYRGIKMNGFYLFECHCKKLSHMISMYKYQKYI